MTTTVSGASNGSFVNSGNAADSLAQGNINGVSVSLATISSGAADGIAVATVSVNSADINAITQGITGAANLVGFTSGSVEVASNSIDATTTVNNGSGTSALTINNSLPVGYTTTAGAPATAILGNELTGSVSTLDADGTLVAANTQVDTSLGSQAIAGGNSIRLTLNSFLGNTVTGSAVLDSNNIGATFTGNTRTSTIGIESDTASFGGTAVIANAQTAEGNVNALDVQAFNTSSTISAIAYSGDFVTPGAANVFSNSSLSVDSNQITSAASGNVLTGAIALGDGLSFNSAGANTSTALIDGLVTDGGGAAAQDVSATGALTIASDQSLIGTDGFIKSETSGARITAGIQESVGSATTLSTNRVTAAATGNRLNTSVVSGVGSALFDGSATLANRQGLVPLVDGFDVSATTAGTLLDVGLGVGVNGTVSGSSATIGSNIIASSAIGSQADQTIALSAASLTTSDGYAVLGFDGSPSAATDAGLETTGAVTIASRQLNDNAAVSASTIISAITLRSTDDDGVTANTDLAITGNIQQAFAVGSDAGNTLSLAGVSVGAAAGIANSQENTVGSSVTANQSGNVSLLVAESAGGAGVSAPSLTVSGNRSEALATGVTAANALSVDATTVGLASVDPTGPSGAQTLFYGALDTGSISASYGVLNKQLVSAAVSATAQPLTAFVESAFAVTVLDNTLGAGVINDANRLTAQAQAAVAANSIDLNIGTITLSGGNEANNVAALLNVQKVEAAVTATAAPVGTGAVVLTRLGDATGDDLTGASVSTSTNRITAIADGAVATNSLSASGTNLEVYETAGGNVGLASDISGTLTANAAFSLMNSQDFSAGSAVTATLRQASSTPGVVTDSALVLTSVAGDVVSSSIASSGNTLTALASSLEAANSLSLDGASWVTTSGALANRQFSAASVNALIGYDGPALGNNAGGVQVAIGENISDSSVSVAGNSVTGQALGNTASNSLRVAATQLDGDGANGAATATNNASDSDYALYSIQFVTSGSAANAEVFATFAIDQAPDQAIGNSTLAVDGNAQVAEAMANSVTNILTVSSATDMGVFDDTSAALSSLQSDIVGTNVDARSDMEVFANVQSSASTITLDGNSNRAIGVVNNAANSLTVDGNNIDGTGSNASVTVGIGLTAEGNFALSNTQSSGGTLDTTASTNVYNNDLVDTASTGIVGGSVSMANNLTFAESSANRASNSVSVAGGASNAAPAALANSQDSFAAVNATAQSSVGMNLTGTTTTTEAVDGSAVSVAGNITQALARGNSATNTMVFSAGADFGTATTGADINSTTPSASAAAAVLNRQNNYASVAASTTGSYQVALNGGAVGATDAAVLNGAISVSGNTVVASAFGNQATNRMEMAVLNSGNATAAFNNIQSNSGVITATANNVTFASSVTGTVTNGAFRNVGNAASATAVGNSSITSIIGR